MNKFNIYTDISDHYFDLFNFFPFCDAILCDFQGGEEPCWCDDYDSYQEGYIRSCSIEDKLYDFYPKDDKE